MYVLASLTGRIYGYAAIVSFYSSKNSTHPTGLEGGGTYAKFVKTRVNTKPINYYSALFACPTSVVF